MTSYDYRCRMTDEELQSFWPGWHVVSFLGGGAYGSVFRICHYDNRGVRTESALKVIELTDSSAGRYTGSYMDCNNGCTVSPESAFGEIRTMELLKGAPNIVSIEDWHYRKYSDMRGPAKLYIRMELLTSFPGFLHKTGDRMRCGVQQDSVFLSISEVCRMGIDICAALDRCERNRIIHRDIKPANLFRDRFGNYKVGDFGIARQVDAFGAAYSMTGIGTISYMAPEIYMGKPYDHTVDIYALGLVLYQFLNNGRAPLMPDYPTALTVDIINAANYKRLKGDKLRKIPHIDRRLNKIILKACAYRPGARYQSAAEFRKALHDYLCSMAYENDMMIVQSNNVGGIAGDRGYAQEGETTQYSFKTRKVFYEKPAGHAAFGLADVLSGISAAFGV